MERGVIYENSDEGSSLVRKLYDRIDKLRASNGELRASQAKLIQEKRELEANIEAEINVESERRRKAIGERDRANEVCVRAEARVAALEEELAMEQSECVNADEFRDEAMAESEKVAKEFLKAERRIAELEAAQTPKPMSEAPQDGTPFWAVDKLIWDITGPCLRDFEGKFRNETWFSGWFPCPPSKEDENNE